MTAAKDPHKIKNPEKVALSLLGESEVGRGWERLKEDAEAVASLARRVRAFKKFYGVGGDNAYELFEAIGRKRGYLLKGGVIDENRVSIKVIDDWQRGRIKLV